MWFREPHTTPKLSSTETHEGMLVAIRMYLCREHSYNKSKRNLNMFQSNSNNRYRRYNGEPPGPVRRLESEGEEYEVQLSRAYNKVLERESLQYFPHYWLAFIMCGRPGRVHGHMMESCATGIRASKKRRGLLEPPANFRNVEEKEESVTAASKTTSSSSSTSSMFEI